MKDLKLHVGRMKALPSSRVNAAQQKYPYKHSNVSIENLSMESHINCSNVVNVSPVESKLRQEMIKDWVVYEVADNLYLRFNNKCPEVLLLR